MLAILLTLIPAILSCIALESLTWILVFSRLRLLLNLFSPVAMLVLISRLPPDFLWGNGENSPLSGLRRGRAHVTFPDVYSRLLDFS